MRSLCRRKLIFFIFAGQKEHCLDLRGRLFYIGPLIFSSVGLRYSQGKMIS
jgi:hypothetical protein